MTAPVFAFLAGPDGPASVRLVLFPLFATPGEDCSSPPTTDSGRDGFCMEFWAAVRSRFSGTMVWSGTMDLNRRFRGAEGELGEEPSADMVIRGEKLGTEMRKLE